MFLRGLALLFLIDPTGALAEPISIDEKSLVQLAEQSSPNLRSITAGASSARLQAQGIHTQYETRANLAYQHSESEEEGLASFIPVFSPEKGFTVGVSKKVPFGMSVSAEVFGEQINAPAVGINHATRAGTRVNLEVDLLKNLLGRFDRNEIRSRELAAQKADIEADIQRHSFELDIRKLYWSYVANSLSLDLSKQLVRSAEQQLKDAQKRSRAGAADRGDVARNKALVQSRKSSTYLFQYEKEQLEFQLKQLIPALNQKEIRLAPVEIAHTINGVLQCVGEIKQNPDIGPETSDYFKALALLKGEYESEAAKAETTGDWDLKLTSSLQYSGVDEGFDNALEEYQDAAKSGYSVGVSLSIPLEGDASKAEQAQKIFVENQYLSRIAELELKISETHRQILKSLVLLQEAARAQKTNVDNLQTSLTSSKRKYRQARVSINELILEQDNYFRSRLEEIRTKLSVIHALYDYFKVFNNHPCSLNKI